jgi:hypothetical protein
MVVRDCISSPSGELTNRSRARFVKTNSWIPFIIFTQKYSLSNRKQEPKTKTNRNMWIYAITFLMPHSFPITKQPLVNDW